MDSHEQFALIPWLTPKKNALAICFLSVRGKDQSKIVKCKVNQRNINIWKKFGLKILISMSRPFIFHTESFGVFRTEILAGPTLLFCLEKTNSPWLIAFNKSLRHSQYFPPASFPSQISSQPLKAKGTGFQINMSSTSVPWGLLLIWDGFCFSLVPIFKAVSSESDKKPG